MSFEELQKVWQGQTVPVPVTLDASLVMREVRRNQQSLRTTLFWRDAREIIVALLLLVYFARRGLRDHEWTDGLTALACLGVGGFLLVDRLRQRRREPAPHDSLHGWVDASLQQVRHQIWLLKNVWWWYLLPIFLSWLIAIGKPICLAPHPWLALKGRALYLTISSVMFVFIYWLNKMAVRKHLAPREQELQELQAGLE